MDLKKLFASYPICNPTEDERSACLEELMKTELLYYFEEDHTFIIDAYCWEKIEKRKGIFMTFWTEKHINVDRHEVPPFRIYLKQTRQLLGSWHKYLSMNDFVDKTELSIFDFDKLIERPKLSESELKRANMLIHLIMMENRFYSLKK